MKSNPFDWIFFFFVFLLTYTLLKVGANWNTFKKISSILPNQNYSNEKIEYFFLVAKKITKIFNIKNSCTLISWTLYFLGPNHGKIQWGYLSSNKPNNKISFHAWYTLKNISWSASPNQRYTKIVEIKRESSQI